MKNVPIKAAINLGIVIAKEGEEEFSSIITIDSMNSMRNEISTTHLQMNGPFRLATIRTLVSIKLLLLYHLHKVIPS